MKKSVWRCD